MPARRASGIHPGPLRPGVPPFVDSLSCDATHWCAALTIDSLECTAAFASTFGKDAQYGTNQFNTFGYPQFISPSHNNPCLT